MGGPSRARPGPPPPPSPIPSLSDFDPDAIAQPGLLLESIYCPACNRPNKVGTTFCAHCATYLGDLEDQERPDPAAADALDNLVLNPEAPEEADSTPAPSAPQAAAPASTPSPPPESLPPPPPAVDTGPDPDILDQPVTLSDGRVVKRRSTLEKLKKLQEMTGADFGISDIPQPAAAPAASGEDPRVAELEEKVAQQAAEIEKLQQEKETIVQEFMADALEADEDAAAEALEAERERSKVLEEQLEAAKALRDKLRAELEAATSARDQAVTRALQLEADAAMAEENDDSAVLVGQLETHLKQTKQQLTEAQAELESSQRDLAAARQQLAEASSTEGDAAAQLTALKEELTLAQEAMQKHMSEAATLREGVAQREAKLSGLGGELDQSKAKLEQAMARIQAGQAEVSTLRDALQAAEADLEAARSQSPGDPGGADPAELELARKQLTEAKNQISKVSEAARDQVQAVTRYYERVLAKVASGVLVLDAGGLVLSVNPEAAQLLGVQASQVIRKPYTEIAVLAGAAEGVARVLAEGVEVTDQALASLEGVLFSASPAELGSRKVVVLAFQPPAGPAPAPAAEAEAAGPASERFQEDLFGLRMMIELLASKASSPGVVENVCSNLLEDVDRMLRSSRGED